MFWMIVAIITLLTFTISSTVIIRKKKEIKQLDEGTQIWGWNDQVKEEYNYTKKIAKTIAIVAIVILGITTIACTIFTQGPGESSVLVSISGKVQSVNSGQGFRLKAPWTRRVVYDIRNNTLSYVGDGESNNNGGSANGPQITFQDKDGVSGNLDLVVRYSVNGKSVEDIYNEYKTQPEFVNSTLANDVRSISREVLSKYSTIEVFSDRDKIRSDMMDAFQEQWNGLGVTVEDVYLQEVRYADSVKQAFESAQNSRTAVEQAKADQEKAKIEAETNDIKSSSLSSQILQEKLIDAIKNGNGTYVIGTDAISVGVK